ncbi:MAG TPA: enoyl-CoA hydratase/isomerase family protein [Acidimicrobiales bacterium]
MTETVDLGSPHLVATVQERVLRVRINRVERRNAMTQDMYRGVKRAAIRADGDPEIDLVCITGTGDVFASGGDMGGSSAPDPTLASEHDPTDHFPFRHLERCRKPVFAAINGICHAGGLNLALYSDFSIAVRSATFRAPELLRGVPDPYIAARLADYVGVGNARWMLFTAAVVSADEARAMGLVARVVDDGAFDDAVAETIAQLRRLAPKTTASIKDDINRGLRQPDVRIFHRSIMSPEMREGMRAFIEKREPVWPRD